jgi:hypothetical protein
MTEEHYSSNSSASKQEVLLGAKRSENEETDW